MSDSFFGSFGQLFAIIAIVLSIIALCRGFHKKEQRAREQLEHEVEDLRQKLEKQKDQKAREQFEKEVEDLRQELEEQKKKHPG